MRTKRRAAALRNTTARYCILYGAGEATYSPQGKAQLKEQVAYYMNNAAAIKNGLKEAGYTVFAS